MRTTAILASAVLGMGLSAWAQNRDTISSGTQIEVRTNEAIDVRDTTNGRIYTGVVNHDVVDGNGNVAIPQGSNAELIVRSSNNRDLALDLESVNVNGRRYMVSSSVYDRGRSQGVGKNKRTGEFVGGGALLGTILGAVAGGGKGAAIGALAGGAAGAGTETITRGKAVRVPSESVLTFRLEQPLTINAGPDNGYDRDGHHYHNDYRYRDNQQNPQNR